MLSDFEFKSPTRMKAVHNAPNFVGSLIWRTKNKRDKALTALSEFFQK
jgi:hypothetical protein